MFISFVLTARYRKLHAGYIQERSGQETADHSAHSAHNDGANAPITPTAHHLAGQPTGQQPNDNPCETTHCSPFLLLRAGDFCRYPGKPIFLAFKA